jgi:hypothetical protein
LGSPAEKLIVAGLLVVLDDEYPRQSQFWLGVLINRRQHLLSHIFIVNRPNPIEADQGEEESVPPITMVPSSHAASRSFFSISAIPSVPGMLYSGKSVKGLEQDSELGSPRTKGAWFLRLNGSFSS